MAVTPADIAVELGRTTAPSSVEETQWTLWISDARMLVSARLGDLTKLNPERLDYVVRQAVTMHVRRPDDATQVAVSLDDGSVSRTFRSSRGRVEILDEWWDLLSPKPSDSGKAFSVDTVPTVGGNVHLAWCNLAFGATYCSCGTDIAGYPIFEGAW